MYSSKTACFPDPSCSAEHPLAGKMTGLSAAEVITLAVAWASLYAVTGFTTPLLCDNAFGRASHSSLFSTRTSAVRERGSRGLAALQAAAAGEDDGIDEYKRQMEEFMAQAHEKRLEAMEAVKAEVQRGYEEQIAELQAKASAVVIWPTASSRVSFMRHNQNYQLCRGCAADVLLDTGP